MTHEEDETRRNEEIEQDREYHQNLRIKYFNAMCPPLYRESDINRLAKDKVRRVLEWTYGPRGILFIGPPGSGKTRLAWLLLRRLVINEGRRVKSFDGIGWASAVSKNFANPDMTGEWLTNICKAEVLFIDDLLKNKFTEAQEEALFQIFERRSSHYLPIIATTNSTGEMLLARMTDAGREDRGPALLRRIREFCEIVVLDKIDTVQ